MNKFVLKAAVAAVAATFAGSALAAVNLQTGAGSVAFASELQYTDANPLVGAGGGQLGITGTLGFGVSAGATRYIRISFGNATLDGAAGALTAPDAGTIVQGGAAGDNYVIYQFTAAANRAPGDTVTIGDSAAGYRVTSNGSPVTVTYRLHETAVDAVNNTNALFTAGPVNLATFSAGLKYTVTAGSSIANVTDGFKKFCTTSACAATTTTRAIGAVNYGVNAVMNRAGTAIALTDLVTAATNIVVSGDMTASGTGGAVFLATDATGACTSSVAGTLNVGETQSVIVVGTTARNADICWTVDGTSVIPAMTVNQMLDVTAAATTTTADTSTAALGSVTRNGASTTALNVTDPANSDQTFIRISNMGSTTGKITGTLYGQDGTQLGAADVTLVSAAGPRSTTVFSASQLATAFGVSGWTGRAKLVIVGEFPAGQLRAQNLIRTPNGTLVNVGGDTSGNSN